MYSSSPEKTKQSFDDCDRSRGRRSRSPERRKRSPPRGKRARSRSNDSAQDAKRKRELPSAEKAGKPSRDSKTAASDKRTDPLASQEMPEKRVGKDAGLESKPSKADVDPSEGATKVEGSSPGQVVNAAAQQPLPPPPARSYAEGPPTAAVEGTRDPSLASINEEPKGNGVVKEGKSKKEKKDKEVKKHKKEKKEKKESKKTKTKAKDGVEESGSPQDELLRDKEQAADSEGPIAA